MSKGVSNFQIEKALKNINDEDINNNFVGVFLSNYMNQFINQAAMISQKRENIHLSLLTLTGLKKAVLIGVAYLILNQNWHFLLRFCWSWWPKKFHHTGRRKVIEKILFGAEQMTRTDNKITLFDIRFNLNACKNLSIFFLILSKLSATNSNYAILSIYGW